MSRVSFNRIHHASLKPRKLFISASLNEIKSNYLIVNWKISDARFENRYTHIYYYSTFWIVISLRESSMQAKNIFRDSLLLRKKAKSDSYYTLN